MTFIITWTNGLVFGIEHLTNPDPEDTETSWMVVLHLACFKLIFIR